MNENKSEPSEENEEEDLRNENEFLKMKLMLEQGAHFGSVGGESKLPPGLENEFLKNIIDFEKQFHEHKTIKVFDKIERPNHFKAVDEIEAGDIENSWKELNEYLDKYGLHVDVCSPNITTRELYRFATEELFDHEIDDMNVPGMTTCFTYDEFHPDYKYDNTEHAINYCVALILRKEPVDNLYYLDRENLRLNGHYPLSEQEFNAKINLFKEAYDDISVNEIKDVNCFIDDKQCEVRGTYDVVVKLTTDDINLSGNWLVEFTWDEDYWKIVNVQIEGISF